jgi:hypothetical protein
MRMQANIFNLSPAQLAKRTVQHIDVLQPVEGKDYKEVLLTAHRILFILSLICLGLSAV